MGKHKFPEVQVGSGQAKPKDRRKLLIYIGAGLVLLAIIVAMVAAVLNRQPGSEASGPKTPEQKRQAIQDDINQADQRGDYGKTAKEIESYLATDPPAADKAMQTQQLGSAYLNGGEYDKAIQAFQQAAQMDDKFKISSLQGEAQAYEAKGDKQKAADLHKQVIELLKAQGKEQNQSKIMIEEQIVKGLEGTL